MSRDHGPVKPVVVSRRSFLGRSAGLTFTLCLGNLSLATQRPAPAQGLATINAYVHIEPSGLIRILTPSAEMGQGTWTSLPIVVAEELDADWKDVRIQASPPSGEPYGDPMVMNTVFTFASRSAPLYFDRLRRYGAQARQVLLYLGAMQLGVDTKELSTRPSFVCHPASGRCISYGQLAADADLPENLPSLGSIQLKSPRNFRLIGQPIPRHDLPSKTDGSTKFSIDVAVPGMLYASVSRSPILGTAPVIMDDDAARKSPGVKRIMQGPEQVAVVASGFHEAVSARQALDIRWSGPNGGQDYASKEAIDAHSAAARDLSTSGFPWDKSGDLLAGFEAADSTIEREYRSDYMYHAQMEPLNAVVSVNTDEQSAEVWAGTQAPAATIDAVARTTGIPHERVHLHRTMLGGGFGRRTVYSMDFVTDAAWVSKEIGAPVKVIWTREDDFAQGHFRPMSAQYLKAGLDSEGEITAWHQRVASEDPIARFEPLMAEAWGPLPVIAMLGSEHYGEDRKPVPYAYDLPNRLAEHIPFRSPLRVYAMRGVGAMANKFAMESFVDELADVRRTDPLEFRKRLLHRSKRALRVLETVADMCKWGSRDGLGLAYSHYANSPAACVVATTLAPDGRSVSVDEVWVAADVGIPIQPDVVKAQLEGGVIYGLSNCLEEQIEIVDGVPKQSNFHEYPVMRLKSSPTIHVRVLSSDEQPTGVGEVGTVVVSGALANSIASSTGARLRHLPLTAERLRRSLNS